MSRVLLSVLVLLLGAAIWVVASEPADSHPQVEPAALRPMVSAVDSMPRGNSPHDTPPPWVLAPPESLSVETPTNKLNPCDSADPGFGTYEAWDRGVTKGQLLCPKNPSTDDKGNVRVMFHFHGHEAVRKEWVQVTGDVVLVAHDFGNTSSAYAEQFADTSRFGELLANVEDVVGRRVGHSVAIGRIGLSAWSAGYAAVRAILNSEYRERVDSVVLLDGLHASTLQSNSGRAELEPFVEFAQRAARNETLMYVSHSSINPPDYISTTQATSYLIWALGGNPQAAQDLHNLPEGVELYRRFDVGGFHAVGLRGVTKEDHCAQVRLYSHALRTYVLPRWGLNAMN